MIVNSYRCLSLWQKLSNVCKTRDFVLPTFGFLSMIVHLDFHFCHTNEILTDTFNGSFEVPETSNGDGDDAAGVRC